jgi:hypothetical protein
MPTVSNTTLRNARENGPSFAVISRQYLMVSSALGNGIAF